MSSLYKCKNNKCWTLNIKNPEGKSKRIRLPRGVAKKDAFTFQNKCDCIVAARRLNEPFTDELITWINNIDQVLKIKLIDYGLLLPAQENRKPCHLSGWVDYYNTAELVPNKENRRKITNVSNKLIQYFGADCKLENITKLDALKFVNKLSVSRCEGGFGLKVDTTAPRAIGYVRQIFGAAVDDGVIPFDPFKQPKISTSVGRGRGVQVPKAVRNKIYNVLPDNVWRLRHLLISVQGMAPSELNHLCWSDIDWDEQSMSIYKQKTKMDRKSGIMPEVMPLLREVFDAAPEGTEHVVRPYSHAHLTREYHKFILKADVEPWECLFISLRKSAVNDAHDWAQANDIPPHVIDQWFGHTEAVSKKYYKAANDNHYSKLRSETAELSQISASVSQQVSQQSSDSGGTDEQAELGNPLDSGSFQHEVEPSGIHQNRRVGDIGFEPMTPSLSSWCSNQLS